MCFFENFPNFPTAISSLNFQLYFVLKTRYFIAKYLKCGCKLIRF